MDTLYIYSKKFSPIEVALEAVNNTDAEQAEKIERGFRENRISLKALIEKLRKPPLC